MTEIADLAARRARSVAHALLGAYDRQRQAMRLAGRLSSELAPGDDGGTVVADLAACITVASHWPPALTAPVLDRLRLGEERAFAMLERAQSAYWGSDAVRRALGAAAAEPFRRLREAWAGARPA